MLFEYAAVSGILQGLFYGLMALGLSLTFGVLKALNIAHGDIVVLGSYAAYAIGTNLGVNPLFAMVIVVLPAVGVGFLLYYGVTPILKRSSDPEMLSLILFFGVSQVLEALETIGLTNSQKALPGSPFGFDSVSIAGQHFPGIWIVTAAVCLPVMALVFWGLYRTRLGLAVRALMNNMGDARAVGINVERVSAITFGVGTALAAITGPLNIYMQGGVNPTQGIELTIVAFAVVILGAMNNPLGALVGGIVYGLAYQFTLTFEPSWANLVPYLLLIIMIIVKPTGLLGRPARYA